MAWMIGIDEAGYGPNLGPLVVAATAWRVQRFAPSAGRNAPPTDLYAQLADAVSSNSIDDRIAIADSKLLYKPRGGLRLLERGVLTGLEVVRGQAATRWQHFWDATLADPAGHRHRLPWYVDYDCPLPINADATELADLRSTIQTCCEKANVALVDIRARAVFPREFNDLTDRYGTKGAALSHVSIALAKDIVKLLSANPQSPVPIHITCDKHGGRNRYAALLQHHFPDEWIETQVESRSASRYQWGPPERRTEITFRTQGEAELPTALASMSAKYLRELAMRAFNEFWNEKVPGLQPTAGYPVDAKRFRAEIADEQRKLSIDDRDLWRTR